MSILKINSLTKLYNNNHGINNVNMEINKGEIVGFIGPNGAGKSTTIRCIMNLLNYDGTITFNNQPLTKNNHSLRYEIGYLPSEINLYEDMTIRQMIDYHKKFYAQCDEEKLVNLLKVDTTRKISELSLGNLKKVGIILALMHHPKLLILDEPTSGLDPLMQQTFYNLLLEEKAKGTTILYSTHILSEVSKICDRILFIKDGKIIKETPTIHTKTVTITSKDINIIKQRLNIQNDINNNSMKFTLTIPMQEFLNKIYDLSIEDLFIEETSIEDLFINEYL